MGMLRSSGRLPPSAALVRAMRLIVPVAILPEGITRLARVTAATASSGEMPYCWSLSGFSVMTMVRWLPPKGGGADTPGRVANSGRAVEREILHFPLCSRGAAEDQLADGHAARVEAR